MEYVKLSLKEYESLKSEAKQHKKAYKDLMESLNDEDKIFIIDIYGVNSFYTRSYTAIESVKDNFEIMNKQIKRLENELEETIFTRIKKRLCKLLKCECNE